MGEVTGIADNRSFNEAGAKSAGKHVLVTGAAGSVGSASMRPAQKAPENAIERLEQKNLVYASMRPAQKAPENFTSLRQWKIIDEGFNEAGAKSAGKRRCLLRRHAA